jgi:cyclopropane-fatty-acyl-phospholipid synthase
LHVAAFLGIILHMSARIADLVGAILGDDLPIVVEAYDGSRLGPERAPATLRIRSPDAVRRLVTAPGELGLARAYVAGDLDLDGDIYALLALQERLPQIKISPRQWALAARLVGSAGLRPLAAPPEEARLRGRRHSRSRDAAAISHHYDVSNDFYRILLGPAMTYSCAVWSDPGQSLESAQAAKHELVCRKLALRPGQRLLDVGCGWGSMAMHAARHHGARVVGVTISQRQAELARERVAEAGLSDQVEIRLQDYRDVTDGPFDAISSIGMFEHVGRARMVEYLERLRALLRPGGRLLNHAISRPHPGRPALSRRGFINRYVFPDGELHEVGTVVSDLHRVGLEVRHLESLREHYALTTRAWVRNLEQRWDEAVSRSTVGRARVWRLYLAGSAMNFEANRTQVHQVLAVRTEAGRSGMPLRPAYEEEGAPLDEATLLDRRDGPGPLAAEPAGGPARRSGRDPQRV